MCRSSTGPATNTARSIVLDGRSAGAVRRLPSHFATARTPVSALTRPKRLSRAAKTSLRNKRRISNQVERLSRVSLDIASVPSVGPGTSSRNAHRQPTTDAIMGISRMVTMVSRNPAHICTVSAVPT